MMKPDAWIHLYSQPSTGRWGFQIDGPHYMSKLGAGRLPSANKHTALAVALVSALDALPASIRAVHLVRTGEFTNTDAALRSGRLLRVNIMATNGEFLDGIRAMAASEPDNLKVAREICRHLRRRVKRYEIATEHVDQAPERLTRFTRMTLPSERFAGSILPALTINAA